MTSTNPKFSLVKPGGAKPDYTVIGDTGLNRAGGLIFEEYLPELRGERGRRVLREMIDGDAIIGGILFAIEMMIRRVDWRLDPADDSEESLKWAERVDLARADMESSWVDLMAEAITFIPWGFSIMEVLWKRCEGDTGDPLTHSRTDDGLIAWRNFAPRAQDTLLRWELADDGTPTAMVQLVPYTGKYATIPLAKCLHFKTVQRKNSPEGRALDPDTLIPTPDGWRMLDDIQPGDKVFDEQGRVRYVTARADWRDRPCYELTFTDGSTIIADAEHQWVTQLSHERSSRTPGKVRTTARIAETLKVGTTHSNHSIAWAGALDYPKQILPVDPYYFGVWLGDGTAASSFITSHVDDVEEMAAHIVETSGYTTAITGNGEKNGNGRLIRVYGSEGRWDSNGPASAMRALGVLNNKHIPEVYLRGSIHQRRELLAGLMDSDGTVDAWGRCEFANTNKALIDGVAELVRSLGVGCTIGVHHTPSQNPAYQTSWRVKFTPPWSPFRLSRKTAKTIGSRGRTNHYIVDAKPVAPRRTVCIEVDSPSHLFLAGTSMIPTHNSAIRNCYNSWYLKKRIQMLEAIGIERNWVGLPVARIPGELLAPGATADQIATRNAIQTIVTNLRNDEQGGVLWPSDRDELGNPEYELEFLHTGGAATLDTDRVIQRHNRDIARALQAGFIFLSDGQGSYALSVSQTGFFARALAAWVKHICDVINRSAIEPMMRYNGVPQAHWPKLNHGDIGEIDMEAMSNNLLSLAQAGLINVADPDLRKWVALMFGLPTPDEEDEQAEEGADPTDPNGGGIDPGTVFKIMPVKEEAAVPTGTKAPTSAAPQGGTKPQAGVKAVKGAKRAPAKAPQAAAEPNAGALALLEKAAPKYKGLLTAEQAP